MYVPTIILLRGVAGFFFGGGSQYIRDSKSLYATNTTWGLGGDHPPPPLLGEWTERARNHPCSRHMIQSRREELVFVGPIKRPGIVVLEDFSCSVQEHILRSHGRTNERFTNEHAADLLLFSVQRSTSQTSPVQGFIFMSIFVKGGLRFADRRLLGKGREM